MGKHRVERTYVSVVFLGFRCILGDLYVDEKNPGEGAKWTCRKEIVGVNISEQARAGKINPYDLRQGRGECTWAGGREEWPRCWEEGGWHGGRCGSSISNGLCLLSEK